MSDSGLATSRIALRDRAFVDVVDLSFRVLRDSFSRIALLSLIVLPVPAAITIWLGQSSWWLAWTFALGTSGFASAPFTALVGQFVFEQSPSVRTALATSLRALPRLIAMNIVFWMLFVVAAAFLILPAFWVAAICFFMSEALLLERATVVEALSRSSRLGGRAGGEVVMGCLVLTMIFFVGPMLAHQIGSIALEHLLTIHVPPTLFEEGGSWLAAIGFWLFVPYAALVRFLFYINVRTRTEGWDIQTAFATIAARARAEDEALS